MEIRVENTITIGELEKLKNLLDEFFKTDFVITLDYNYAYLRDKT